jgi:hypothetical protein
MKRILTTIIFCILCMAKVSAQDKIFKKGGEVIDAKVTEIGEKEIKYKLSSEPDAVVYVISKDNLIKVVFANGRTETYERPVSGGVDRIYKKGGEVIPARIMEVGDVEIRYKLDADPEGLSYGIAKDKVAKVVYANGRSETYVSGLKDNALYEGQSRNALKLNILSPLSGYLGLTFEHSMGPGKAMEFNLAIIGLGKNPSVDYISYPAPQEVKRDARGVGVGFGYKFIKTPDFLVRDIRFAHLLQGGYVKPVVYLGTYGENVINNKTNVPTTERRSVVYGSLMIEMGKQWVFSESVLFDIYGGVGYAFDNNTNEDFINTFNNGSHFNFVSFGSTGGFALSAGLRFGVLLGKKQKN